MTKSRGKELNNPDVIKKKDDKQMEEDGRVEEDGSEGEWLAWE